MRQHARLLLLGGWERDGEMVQIVEQLHERCCVA